MGQRVCNVNFVSNITRSCEESSFLVISDIDRNLSPNSQSFNHFYESVSKVLFSEFAYALTKFYLV